MLWPQHPDSWAFLGTLSTSHAPTPCGTLSPAGGAGVHHHVDLQPQVQEVQGRLLGAERGQGQLPTRTGVRGEGLGCCDEGEGGSGQGRGAPGYDRILGQDKRPK